ncbi:BrnA antitoxin family protein [Ectothiorhodospira marina]
MPPRTQATKPSRLSPDVVEEFRASGPGWQSRMDAALRDRLRDHSPDNF